MAVEQRSSSKALLHAEDKDEMAEVALISMGDDENGKKNTNIEDLFSGDSESSEVEDDAEIVKFANQNKRFWGNLYLALVIATWMTLFGLPVYSETAKDFVFGAKHIIVDGEVLHACGMYSVGFQLNLGNATHMQLADYNSTHMTEGLKPDWWCGVMPETYLKTWPHIVQTAMFTLYVNTGTTMKLAVQCMSGTLCAVLNGLFMCWLYPEGAKNPDTYNEFVAWIDVCVVVFLFMASRADVNTMMLGLCWTVVIMLHFMNKETGPNLGIHRSWIPGIKWDAETTVVLVTSLLGCIIAVASTMFPLPLLNIKRVHDDAIEVVKGIEVVFTEAIDYYCHEVPNPKRYQVFAKISALESTIERVGRNLEDSFWETFNLCGYGKMRRLYSTFNESTRNAQDELYLIKAACSQLDFNDRHMHMARALRTPMMSLKEETVNCLTLCARCCKDGVIDEEERVEIQAGVAAMALKQQELMKCYQMALSRYNIFISKSIAPDTCFIFSLSQWSRELQDWAADLAEYDSNMSQTDMNLGKTHNFLCECLKYFYHIFDPVHMFKFETLRFAFSNSLPILITFAIALYSSGSVFVQYASTMPCTLAVLVSYDSASFFKNLQRLMGVTFGQTLPLLVMSVVGLLSCESELRFAIHMLSIFFFYFAFTFMYYASEQWSTIGCLIAGFGCYTLFQPCEIANTSEYARLYKNIAEVIIAILLKMAITGILSAKEPRDQALENLKVVFEETQEAFRTFLVEGRISDDANPENSLEARARRAKEALEKCKELLPQCDPKIQMMPGFRTPFKLSLYSKVLDQMRLVISDVYMLIFAMQGHLTEHTIRNVLSEDERRREQRAQMLADKQEVKIIERMQKMPSWPTIRDDVLVTIERAFGLCTAVLEHASEEPLESPFADELKHMDNLMELDSMSEFYEEISREALHIGKAEAAMFKQGTTAVTQLRSTRFTVAINSLSLATEHTAVIATACFEHMLYF